jgi:hypothetical protein
MSEFAQGPEAEEPKAGKILTLEQVAEVLKKNIEKRDQIGVNGILNSFEQNTTAEDLINYLSQDDFRKLIELQEKANSNVIETNDIDEYVSISDKIAGGLLCAGRALDKGLTGICNAVSSAAQMTKKIKNERKNIVNNALNSTKSMIENTIENTVNTYDHTRWFLNTVLIKQAENKNNTVSKHIYDKYGYLLVTYKDGDFDFNDAMTSILMPQIVKAVKKTDGSATQNDYEPTAENITQNLSSEPVSSSQPTDFKMSPFEDIKDIEKNVLNNLQTLQKLQKQNNNDTLIPRIILLKEIKQKGIKRSHDDVSYDVKDGSEEEKQPNKRQNNKVRPNTGGKSRRKIRRNKKAKTKKRKTNKKTKKRKMKTKTKKTKRKTNKRRTKK